MLALVRVTLWFVFRVLLHVAVLALVAVALLLRAESPPDGGRARAEAKAQRLAHSESRVVERCEQRHQDDSARGLCTASALSGVRPR